MDRLDAFKSIATQAGWGELTFPTHVEASLKIQNTLEHTDCSAATAARLVQSEPLLAARTVAIANSVAYRRSGMQITSVLAAVQRVGFRTLSALVAAVILRQLECKIMDRALLAMADQLWRHTVHVAALARVLARRYTDVDPELAMFAGIVHEVGGFFVLSRAEEFPGLLDGPQDLWIAHGEQPVSRGVLRQLAVPESVQDAIATQWSQAPLLPPATLAGILPLADLLAPVPSPLHPRPGYGDWPDEATDCAPDAAALGDIREESDEQVRQLFAALR